MEIMPFTIATNNIKYLGVTLTKQVKDLYDKNFQFFKKKIEEGVIGTPYMVKAAGIDPEALVEGAIKSLESE